jgi:diamine N-acetyltransferase
LDTPHVALRAISAETVREICALETSHEQLRFVATNSVSIAQAYFEPTAEFRAIYAHEASVGFVMWRADGDASSRFLWRLMIDHRHQGKGYGRIALRLLVEHLQGQGVRQLRLSFVAGEGGPEEFYRAFGFEPTGELLHNGEHVMRLTF